MPAPTVIKSIFLELEKRLSSHISFRANAGPAVWSSLFAAFPVSSSFSLNPVLFFKPEVNPSGLCDDIIRSISLRWETCLLKVFIQ